MVNVPNVPGVPPLPSYSGQVFGLLTSDIVGIIGGLFVSQWGIFFNGIPVLSTADNFVSFDFKQDFALSDYPVEGALGGLANPLSIGGSSGFQTYNKVALPADIRVRASCGGSEAKRQAFLATCAAIAANTFLYDVVTPERIFLNYNFSHWDFRRQANQGNGLVSVDLWLTEIRTSFTATFTSTSQPGEAGGQALGAVQPEAPSDVVLQGPGGGFF